WYALVCIDRWPCLFIAPGHDRPTTVQTLTSSFSRRLLTSLGRRLGIAISSGDHIRNSFAERSQSSRAAPLTLMSGQPTPVHYRRPASQVQRAGLRAAAGG